MHFSTSLLAPASLFFLTTVTVKAQFNPNVWTDSVATRRMLADTSMVSPFMTLGATKHDEKIAAIKAYCDCEAIRYTERKDRFEALRKKWPHLVRSRDIYAAKDYIMGGFDWKGEGLSTPVRFEFSPLVKPLVKAPQLAEMEREKEGVYRGTLNRNSGEFTCHEQVRLMYPAYAPATFGNAPFGDVSEVYSEVKNELVRQDDSYKEYFHTTIEPWLDSVYKRPSTVAHVDERRQSSKLEIGATPISTKIAAAKPTSIPNAPRVSDGGVYKYPIVITNVPYSEFDNVYEYKLDALLEELNRKYRPGIKFRSYYAFINATGRIMKVDSSKHPSRFGYPGKDVFESDVKYTSKLEADSFRLAEFQKVDASRRIVYRTVGFPEGTYNGGTRLRPEKVWLLTNSAGIVVSSYNSFSCAHPNARESKSRIQYIGSGRYWVSRECEEGSASYLLNESGKILAQFSPRQRVSTAPGEFTLNSAPSPVSKAGIAHLGHYNYGVLLLDDNSIIDLNGRVIYRNNKYKIMSYIDKNIALATTVMPKGQYVYAYVNYRTGKVIYTALDYERSGFVSPIIR